MAVLSEFNSAAQLREIIRGYAAEVVDEERPPTRYAIVTAVHPTLRVATVRYPDEVATFTIPYGSAQPVVTHTVRVAGKQGARYIEDVLHTGTSDADSVPSGQKIYHRIAGNNILTIQNPNDPATTATFGGYVMEMHPGYGGSYLTLHPAHYAAAGYVILNDTSNTFISANTGGTVFIRAGANDSAHQVAVSPTSVDIAGNWTANGGVAYSNSTGLGSTLVVVAGTKSYANGTAINMGPWDSDGAWSAVQGNGGYLLLNHSTSPSNAYLRCKGGTLYLGGGSVVSENNHTMAGNLQVNGVITSTGNATFNGASTSVNTINSGRSRAVWSGGAYNEANHFSDSPAYGVASNSYHPSGVACQFRMGINIQTLYLMGINGGDNNVTLVSAAFANSSSRTLKQDIHDWPLAKSKSLSAAATDFGPVDPIEAIKAIRPVWFRREENQWFKRLPPTQRRTEALARLNAFREERGQEHFDSPELRHICGRDCNGDADNPCEQIRDWETGVIGFISEEVGEVLPQVTRLDPFTGTHNGIDPLALASLGVAVSKQQQEMIETLMTKVEELQSQVAALTSSGTQQ